MCSYLAAVDVVGFVLFRSITMFVGFTFTLPLATTPISCIRLLDSATMTIVRIVATGHPALSEIFPLLNFIKCVRTIIGNVFPFRGCWALLFSRRLGTNSNSDSFNVRKYRRNYWRRFKVGSIAVNCGCCCVCLHVPMLSEVEMGRSEMRMMLRAAC